MRLYQPKDLKINTTDETQYGSQLAVMCFQFLKENKGKAYSPRHLAVQLFGDDGDNDRMKRDSKNVAKVCKHLHRASLIQKGRNLPMKSNGITVNITGFYYE